MKKLNSYCKVMSYVVFLLGQHTRTYKDMFSSLLADKILEDQIHELEEQTFLGMQGDAAYSSNMRITKTNATNLLSALT